MIPYHRVLCSLICILSFLYMKGEIIINGQITDYAGLPLSYVNIGVVGTKIGTTSNVNGYYSLTLTEIPKQDGMIIRFSSIGYKSLTFPVKEFITKKAYNIKLKKEVFTLKTVFVKPEFATIKKIGETKTKTKRNVRFAISEVANQNLGAEIGKQFNFGKKAVFLEKCFFYIKNNNFDTVRFRVNVYKIENGQPAKSLLSKNIITEITGKNKGWISVDLSPYEIYTKAPIILSISWVYHSKEGSYLSLPLKWPSFGSRHFYKFGSQNKWQVFKKMTTAMQLQISY